MQKPISICIIGGGPSGLGVLKVLQETQEVRTGDWQLEAFEARSDLGGVWFPSPPSGDPPESPVYDALTTNLPHPIMAYQSFWFEPSTPLFPTQEVVLDYIRQYAEHFDLRRYYHFNSVVEEALWKENSWHIRISSIGTRQFQKVIVCNGHYREPRYPKIPGLEEWIKLGRASHSAYFRNERRYAGKRVLVIGNGPSGQDISTEIAPVAKATYHSVTGGTPQDVGIIRRRGRVIEFRSDGTVLFDDGGSLCTTVDHVILATGYLTSFPFLPQIKEHHVISEISSLPTNLLNTTYGLFPLARHIFPLQREIPPTSIAFVGLPVRVVPFPLIEAQSRYICRIFQNPETFHVSKEIELIVDRYKFLRKQFHNNPLLVTRNWHVLPDKEQFDYRRELLNLSEASPEWLPEDWAEEIYAEKGKLREIWRQLQKEGKVDGCVKGVGEGGRHEWIQLMKKLLES